MTAGIEGGSRRIIQDEYTWHDWIDACASWRRLFPPAHISIGRFIGIEPGNTPEAPPPASEMLGTAEGLAAELGMALDDSMPSYQRPRKGLLIH